jgi:hypothetical protein
MTAGLFDRRAPCIAHGARLYLGDAGGASVFDEVVQAV